MLSWGRHADKFTINWAAVGGALLAVACSGVFWWFFIWAGTRLWRP